MNRQIVSRDNGFLASTPNEWFEALSTLRSDPNAARRMGAVGRELVEARYSTQVVAPRLEAILRAP